MTRRLAHSLEAEARQSRRPHAVPYRESQRRVLTEAVVDLAAGLAICSAFALSILLLGWLLQTLWPWSLAYVAIFGAGALGLCRAASWGER
ncbi:MAG TPA: hypothetical protein VFK56_02995 [Mycobacterium sp.]|nr:hypothetical protein [Mycobacterium sp.]